MAKFDNPESQVKLKQSKRKDYSEPLGSSSDPKLQLRKVSNTRPKKGEAQEQGNHLQ